MTEKKQTRSKGFLSWVERTGNKIPHPFILFLELMAVVAVLSFVMNKLGTKIKNPTNDEIVTVKNLISGEGISFALTSAIKNFTGFAPLGLVLTMALGIGLAEEIGFMSSLMRKSILGAPPKMVTFAIMIIGICGNIASDAAIVIIPPLSALIFLYLGRNPIAGIGLGYAATTAGFSANLFIAGTDALLQGITNEAAKIVNAPEISVAANWYAMIVSTFLLAIVGTVINDRFMEPRLGKYHGNIQVEHQDVSELEKKGLKASLIALLIFIAVVVVSCIPKNSFMRNPETGSLTVKSTLMSGLIPLLLIMFLCIVIPYGKVVGKIKNSGDIPRYMVKAISKMAPFIVLAFIIGQFVAWFNWTNIGLWLSVTAADALKTAGFVGIPLMVLFILLCAFINLFIGSGSAKWALLAPIFVPMMYLIGYHPAWTQFLYRIGDSSTNIITPLFPYFPIILSLMQEYDEEAGAGTLLSQMIPYSISFLVVWTMLAILWYFIGLPIGVGGFIHV